MTAVSRPPSSKAVKSITDNPAVKSITDNPADLESELRAFAQTGRIGGRRARRWSKEKEAIQKKLDRVMKELDKVKMEAAREIGNLNDAEDHQGHPQGDRRQSVSA